MTALCEHFHGLVKAMHVFLSRALAILWRRLAKFPGMNLLPFEIKCKLIYQNRKKKTLNAHLPLFKMHYLIIAALIDDCISCSETR